MSSEYIFTLSNGTTLGSVHTLEGNGEAAQSVPRQVLDIDFSATPNRLVVADDITARFPASGMLNAVLTANASVGFEFTVSGSFAAINEVKPGNKILISGDGAADGVYTITEALPDTPSTTTFIVAELVPPIVGDGVATTLKALTLSDGAYDGDYFVASVGSTIDQHGNTVIPLHSFTPLNAPSFNVVAASAGAHGSFTIVGADNGSCLFRVGAPITIADNTTLAANGNYTIQTVRVSGSDTIVGATPAAKQITVAGDKVVLYPNGHKFNVAGNMYGNGQYTVASAVVNAGNTVITAVEPMQPTMTSGGHVVMSPGVVYVTTVEPVPAGVGGDGFARPSLPTGFGAFAAPPAITPTTPHNFLVTWRLTGDRSTELTVGCPVVIKNNNYFLYQELPIESVSYDSIGGVTNVVTKVTEQSATTPVINNSGELIFPAPAIPYGYMRYDVPAPLTSLQLVGKGAPSYNSTTTWGETLQRNDIRITENFASGIRTSVLSVVPGVNGKITLPMSFMNDTALVVGDSADYINDTVIGNTTLTIQSILPVANVLEITFAETIPVGAAEDGLFVASGPDLISPLVGQLHFDKAQPQLWAHTDATNVHGVCIATVPMTEYIDMGDHKITNLMDATNPMDAVNLRTSDRLYIAKTGGANLLTTARSGQMFGSLNFGELPVGAPDVLGMNVTDAPVRLYGTADIELDVNGSGNVRVAGTGNVLVDQGNVTVGTGGNTAVLQNNAGAAPTLTFTTSTNSNAVVNLGSNKIVNMSTPSNPTDGANKAYVDGLANGIVWLQPVLDPNLFADTLSAPPFLTASVISATTGAANIWKVAGNFASSFAAGAVLTITNNSFLPANKAYVVVSAVNNGLNTDITVTASTIPVGVANDGTATDTSVAMHKTYIVKAPGTGAWAGLDDHVVTYSVTSIDPVTQVQTWGWVDILGRPVASGDRFGVFVEPDAEDPMTVLPAGSLAGSAGKIATVTTTSPLAYTFYTPTEPYAFSVTGTSPVLNTPAVNAKSPHFGHSYTFRGTWGTGLYGTNYKWIEFAGPSMLIAGAGLKYAGSVLNVGAGPGIISNADTVQLDTTYANGIYVRLDGTIAMTGNLQLGGFKITNVGTPTVASDAANKTYTDAQDALRVAKVGDTMSGTLTFTAGTVTGLAAPSVNTDAATKLYADNGDAQRINRAGDTMTGTLIMSGAGVGITLPNAPAVGTDAVNMTYTDTKLALAGGTMTGPLVLAADPAVPLGAAPKQYVDNNFVAKAVSTTLANNINITFGGTGEVLGLPATPSVAGSATSKAYVDAQDALKADDALAVHKAGIETITGAKTFSAATTLNNQVTVAADGTNTNLLITSTNITLTGTPVTSGGAANITATAGSNTAGVGGNVALAGGNGATNGGNITIIGGQGSAGNGGNITITTGTGTTANGQLSMVAGLASITLNATGVISIGGAIPTAKSQALVSNSTNPTTATPTWQLVGTRVASAPANSAAAGVVGNWFADDSFFYVYGATGWRRSAISTF